MKYTSLAFISSLVVLSECIHIPFQARGNGTLLGASESRYVPSTPIARSKPIVFSSPESTIFAI